MNRILFVPAHAAIPTKALAGVAEIVTPHTFLARVLRERPLGRAIGDAASALDRVNELCARKRRSAGPHS